MTVNRGGGKIKRRHAHNYIGKQADARLQEVISSAQGREMNALQVDSYPILYYRRVNCSVACTCQRVQAPVVSEGMNEVDSVIDIPGSYLSNSYGDEEIVIDHSGPLFGTQNTTGDYEDEASEDEFRNFDDEDIVDDEDPHGGSRDQLFATSADCGICYRTGLVPGYELYGHQRRVLTTAMMENTYGYTVTQSSAPHTFDKVDPQEGFVDFIVEVPKFFQSVRASVRNNALHLEDEMIHSIGRNCPPLTKMDFKYAAGGQIVVRVMAHQFTHVVIDFDLGSDPIHVGMAQDARATDWSLFDTLGQMNLTLPPTINRVETSDALYVPARNITLKVSDVNYLRTASDGNLDWQVQARVLQPQESLKGIWKAYTLR